MGKLISAAFIPVLLLIGAYIFNPPSISAQQNAVTAVSSVDLKRYSGKWFEIARFPNKFQKSCVGNTTAEYIVKEPGSVQVINRCLKKDGKITEAKGKAKIEDKTTNAKLKVRFAPGFLAFLPQVWGDYWILDLDQNYQYAAVGEPDRKYLWILSRTAEMDEATYQQIVRRVEKMGFNPAKLIKTPQNVEALKGATVIK